MTEQAKHDAWNVGSIMTSVLGGGLQEKFLSDEKRFIAACRMFYRHQAAIAAGSLLAMWGWDCCLRPNEMLEQAERCPIVPGFIIEKIKANRDRLAASKTKKQPEPKMGHVYVMLNKRNGYRKIGWSTNPKFREATLQAQEPEIEIECSWSGTVNDEAKLQEAFKANRVRGEWFNLSEADIEAAGCIMDNAIATRRAV